MGVRAHEGADCSYIHEYFNILASSHIAFCQAPISSPVTHNERERRRRREEEGKLMSPKMNSERGVKEEAGRGTRRKRPSSLPLPLTKNDSRVHHCCCCSNGEREKRKEGKPRATVLCVTTTITYRGKREWETWEGESESTSADKVKVRQGEEGVRGETENGEGSCCTERLCWCLKRKTDKQRGERKLQEEKGLIDWVSEAL